MIHFTETEIWAELFVMQHNAGQFFDETRETSLWRIYKEQEIYITIANWIRTPNISHTIQLTFEFV
jgi:hypothetical protein